MANISKLSRCGGGRIRRKRKAGGGNLPDTRSEALSKGQNPLLSEMFSASGDNYLKAFANRDRYRVANFYGGLPNQSLYNLKRDPEKFKRFHDYSKRRGVKMRQSDPDYMSRYNPEVDKPFSVPLGFSVPDEINRSSVGAPLITPETELPEYGAGGDIAKGAASGAMTGMALGPWGAAAGAVIGGVAGWLGGRGEDDPEELAENYIVPQGLSTQHYQRAAAGGGDLTEFVGPRHEEGGIALGGLPVEVEGGETRTGTMIHSDRPEKKVTSAMIKRYPALKKSDKGKTMAQITKREHKKFEKRKWDEMNDNAAEIAMMPFEQISDDLSQQDNQIAAYGGEIGGDPKLPKGYKGVDIEGVPYGRFDFPLMKIFNDDPMVSGMHPTGMLPLANTKMDLAEIKEDRNPKRASKYRKDARRIYDTVSKRPKLGDQYVDVDAISYADGGDILASKAREILSHGAIRGKPITDKQRRFFGAKTKAADGLNLQSTGKYAPLITSGIDMMGSLIGGPEEVDYGKTGFTPTKVSYASAEPGVQRIRRNYANAESKLRRMNPNRYMARINALASGEADAITAHAGQIQGRNVESTNRANIVDAQNATRTNMFNKQMSIREAEANAANRAAWKSRMSANLANIGTMGGQIARDDRLQKASDSAQDRYFKILEEQNRMLGGYPEEEDLYNETLPLSSFAGGGSLTHRLRLRNFKSA